jgi:predicted secreted protein
MAAQAGRSLLIDLDTGTGTEVEIVGQTTGSFTVNREHIDITTKSDDGIRTYLAELGAFSVDVSFEGILKDDAFLAEAFNAAPTDHYAATVHIGGIGSFAGNFAIGPVTGNGADGPNAIGITGSLNSSGTVTYTSA